MIPLTQVEFLARFENEVLTRIEEFEESLGVENVVNIQEVFKQTKETLMGVGILPEEAKGWELFRH